MENEVTIIIADDHPIVRQGFRQIIERDKNLKILAEVGNGQDALEAIKTHRPQLAILDIDMPLMDGFAVARAIHEENLATEIVFLTIHEDEEMFNTAVDLGAKGFLLKDSAPGEIINCLKTVAKNRYCVSSALSTFLMNRSNRKSDLTEQNPTIKDLTPTEIRIIKLIADKKTTKEIAEELFISYRTVETHRWNICQKLGLQGTNSLLKFALTHKSELS